MYLHSMTSQDFQTILKTVFKSGCLFVVFFLSANAAAIAAEVSDLEVETVRVNRTTLHPGDTFRLETVIRNHGKAAATPATLSYYVSSDDTISRADTEIKTETLPRIAAGGTLERSVHLTAPDTPGTYYYGVCVNTVAAEADTTHNCSSATAITVKGADLMIFDAPQLSKTTLKSGETLSVNTRVWNRGENPFAADNPPLLPIPRRKPIVRRYRGRQRRCASTLRQRRAPKPPKSRSLENAHRTRDIGNLHLHCVCRRNPRGYRHSQQLLSADPHHSRSASFHLDTLSGEVRHSPNSRSRLGDSIVAC